MVSLLVAVEVIPDRQLLFVGLPVAETPTATLNDLQTSSDLGNDVGVESKQKASY